MAQAGAARPSPPSTSPPPVHVLPAPARVQTSRRVWGAVDRSRVVWVPFMAILFLFATSVALFDVSASYPAMLTRAQELVAADRSAIVVQVQHVVAAPNQGEPAQLRTPIKGEPTELRPPVGTLPDTTAARPPVVETKATAKATATAMAKKKAKRFHPACNFTIGHFDPSCPRFVHIEPMTSHRGLGDRFVQFLVPYLFALEADAVPLIDDELVDAKGIHGDYAWAKDFFNLNAHLPFPDAAAAKAAYPDLEVVRPNASESTYQSLVDSVKDKCNVIIETDMGSCEGGCYFATKPHFQRVRNVLACNVMHAKDRASLPPLGFDNATDEYVVAIHVRRGDITLHGMGPEATAYFTTLKSQIDQVLRDFPTVHYYFITEGPELQANQAPFACLPSIFQESDDSVKTTYLNHLDPQSSLLHMMNADMLVTTGSSFPYIAATVSPKPVVLFGKPKEHNFFPGYLREDFILVEDDGSIVSPTLGEASALVAIRYEEVHGRPFPYRRRRGLRAGDERSRRRMGE